MIQDNERRRESRILKEKLRESRWRIAKLGNEMKEARLLGGGRGKKVQIV